MNKQEISKTIFVTGGGTGGHIYPAIAVADYMADNNSAKIYYVGNPNNLEYEVVKNKGYDFLPINITAMPRKIGVNFFFWSFKLLLATIKVLFYIKSYNPDAVFGTGGYVSSPALLAAKLTGVATIIHDCDANPGLVTRKFAPLANGVSLSFENAKKFINNPNCIINGTPIRKEFSTIDRMSARTSLGLENKLTLCVMGGSQGAKTINNSIIHILEKLSKEYNIQIIFQTGKKNFVEVISKLNSVYPEYGNDKNIIIKPYFEDMVTVLKSSDIAISRAGSLSIAELCASNVATIFVPYPHAANDHQRKNAEIMKNNNAGLYIEDKDVNPVNLINLLTNLINNSEYLKEIQNNAGSMAIYNSTEKISQQIMNIIG